MAYKEECDWYRSPVVELNVKYGKPLKVFIWVARWEKEHIYIILMMKPLEIYRLGKPRKRMKDNKYFWAVGCEDESWVEVAQHCSYWWSWTLWFFPHNVIQLVLVYLYSMVLTSSTSVAIDSDAFSSADVSLPVTFWTKTCLGMYTVWACNRTLN